MIISNWYSVISEPPPTSTEYVVLAQLRRLVSADRSKMADINLAIAHIHSAVSFASSSS